MQELGVPAARTPDQGVVEWFVDAFGLFLNTLRLHPNALPVIATRPITGDAGMRAAEAVLFELRAIGVPPADSMAALLALTQTTIAIALTENERDPDVMDPNVRQKVMDCYMALSPDEFPLFLEGLTHAPEKDWTRIHQFAISTYISGLLAIYSRT
jgi:hypothetical protein